MKMKVEEIDQIVERFNRDGELTRGEIEYIYSIPLKSNYDLLENFACSCSNVTEMDIDSHDYVYNLVVFKVVRAELRARLE